MSIDNTLQAKDVQISELDNALQAKDSQISELSNALQAKDSQIEERDAILTEHDTQITSLTQTIHEREGQIVSLNQAVTERDERINMLLSSNSWRLTKPLRAAGRILRGGFGLIGKVFQSRTVPTDQFVAKVVTSICLIGVVLLRLAKYIYINLPLSETLKWKNSGTLGSSNKCINDRKAGNIHRSRLTSKKL